jgi:protein phosphatase
MGRIWRALARGAGGDAGHHDEKNGQDDAQSGATSMSDTGGQVPASEMRSDAASAEPAEESAEPRSAVPAPDDGELQQPAAETQQDATLDAGGHDAAEQADASPSPGHIEDLAPAGAPPAAGAPPSIGDEAAGPESQAPAEEPATPTDTQAETSTGDEAVAAVQASAPDAPAATSDTVPLEGSSAPAAEADLSPGTVVADRYTVLRELTSEAASAMVGGPIPADLTALYAVEDRLHGGRCWACGSTHNDPGDAKQRFCVDCGAPLQQESVLARAGAPAGKQEELAFEGAFFRILHRRKQFGSGGMAVGVGAFSVEGPHHPNEDSFWTGVTSGCYDSKADAVCVAVLADGMGGYAPGSGLISKTVVSMVGSRIFGQIAVDRAVELGEDELRAYVREAVEQANGKVLEEIAQQGEMGSTLVVAIVYGRVVYVANIGDSRAYYVSPSGDVNQITRDQSLVQQQVSLGLLPADAPFTAIGNNVILHAVGEERVEEVFDWYVQDLEPGSYVLLCTDGYWKTMRHDVWDPAAAGQETSIHNLASRLAQTAIDRNSDDNTTVVLIEVA